MPTTPWSCNSFSILRTSASLSPGLAIKIDFMNYKTAINLHFRRSVLILANIAVVKLVNVAVLILVNIEVIRLVNAV